MSEYQVTGVARFQTGLITSKTAQFLEVYEAKTAKQAKEMAIAQFIGMCDKEGVDEEDYTFSITDIKKL